MQLRPFWLAVSMLLANGACSGGSGDGTDAIDGGIVIEIDAFVVPDATSCPIATVNCNGSCIDPLVNREFCGATTCEDDATNGEACAPGAVCNGAGSCEAFVCEAVPGGSGAACNPVSQAGCEVGEKCAQLVASGLPFLASTACVPDGTVASGGTCTTCGDGVVGYDNCAAGSDCRNGRCDEICTSAGGDTCRTPGQAFGEGTYCTLFADLFTDEIGLCVPGCDPTIDTVVNGSVISTQCGASSGCYLNIGRGVASCSGLASGAATETQNDECFGPAAGSCFLNGCASGYSPILPNAIGEAATTNTCARYCTPVDTYITSNADADGLNSKCGTAELAAAGSGTQTIAHECHFIQSLYSEPLTPDSQGLCVPVDPWYDCGGTYEFITMRDLVLNAADMATANTAFNNFCYGKPLPLDTDVLLAKCEGISFGCTSLATRAPILMKLGGTSVAPANTAAETSAWLKARLSLPVRAER